MAQYRISLRNGDRFTTTECPDIVNETKGGRIVLRCLVGGRVVRRVIEAVERVDEIDELGDLHDVDLDDLKRQNPNLTQIESNRGVAPAPKATPAETEKAPDLAAMKRDELLALWEQTHPGVEPPKTTTGKTTAAGLRKALAAE